MTGFERISLAILRLIDGAPFGKEEIVENVTRDLNIVARPWEIDDQLAQLVNDRCVQRTLSDRDYYEITPKGRVRKAILTNREQEAAPRKPLQVSCCNGDSDAVLRFVREHETAIRAILASEPPAETDDDEELEEEDDDPHTMFCLTGVALDAWWQSLPVETKADVMVSYYESRALADEPAPELTEAGEIVAAEGR